MKSIVKVLISALALGVMASVPMLQAKADKAPAAESNKGKGRGGLTVERIEEAVGALSAEQKTKIAELIKKADLANVAQEERRDKTAALRTSIAALLTAEQKPKFEAMAQGGKKKN